MHDHRRSVSCLWSSPSVLYLASLALNTGGLLGRTDESPGPTRYAGWCPHGEGSAKHGRLLTSPQHTSQSLFLAGQQKFHHNGSDNGSPTSGQTLQVIYLCSINMNCGSLKQNNNSLHCINIYVITVTIYSTFKIFRMSLQLEEYKL